MADYTRKQLDVDGSYIFPYTHADAVLYTTQNNLDGITSGTETNVKAVLDALDNTYRRLDSNITSLYNSQGKRGFLYLNGTTTTASMELPTQGNDFYVPTLKYDSNGNITTAWQTPASIAAITDLSGYLPLTGGTLTGELIIDANTIGGNPHLTFTRTTYNYIKVPTGGTLSVAVGDDTSVATTYLAVTSTAVYPGAHNKTINLGTTDYRWNITYTKKVGLSTNLICEISDGSRVSVTNYSTVPTGFNAKDFMASDTFTDYTKVPTNGIYAKGNIRTSGNVQVGTGAANSYLASSSATNIYLQNSSGAVLVCDAKVVRRGTSLTDIDLGSSTYPWRALYANTIYENGTSLASKYVTLATDLNITGEKTFTGDKRIKFKQSNSADKLGFTLYNSSNVLVGFFEWEASSINARSALTLGQWVSTNNPATPGYLGFKVVDVTTAARYALVTPLLIDAKTPLSLNDTLKTFYFPLQFKNGSTTVLAASSGVVDLSTLIPSYSTQNMSVNGTNYALYTSASSLPTIYAPTALAGTGGYILATNSGKTGVEWVAKPTSNVSTSAVVSSSASGTTQISAAQSDPYYNLIEGSTVARSIRFVAGTGISISAATDGQITITNTGGGGGSATVSSILASTSTGTSAISGDTLDPYYNLLVNSAVSSSIQFKAGTNMAITAGTDNSITFANTLTKMSQLTNNLFINGTQTGTTGSWKGKLPAEITALYNGLTIFYRLPKTGSGNASLQLYAPDGTTAIGANCPVYAGTTRITTHFPADSIIHMTYYEGNWRAHPYYNTNSNVTQTNSTSTDYRAILLGNQSSSSVSGVATGAVTSTSYKSSNFVYSPGGGRLYIRTAGTTSLHGYYVTSTVANAGYAVGLVLMGDLISRGVRDTYNGKWLWYMNDTTGDTVKTDATVQIDSGIVKLSANCLIAYDSTNQCVNFTFT